MNSILNQIAVKKLKDLDFDAFLSCEQLVKPKIDELELLPQVMELILKAYEPNPENSPIILATVYYLFAPYKLHYQDLRMANGIRKVVCEYMGWHNAPVVNFYSIQLLAYYKNPRWRERVRKLGHEICCNIVTKI